MMRFPLALLLMRYSCICLVEQADFAVSSLDAFVVSPTRSPFPAVKPLAASALAEGMAFNLFNNVWNTNFPLWYCGAIVFVNIHLSIS
jgi:hypothetical protein